MSKSQQAVEFIKKWWISIRPFSLPASTMPVIFGTVLAVVYGSANLKIAHGLLAFMGMVILHAASNIMNDVYDYKKGLDKVANPVSGGIVRGLISIREAKIAYISLYIAGALIGIFLMTQSGFELLYIGVGGLLVGIFYSNSMKVSLKYNALGDLAVFLNFGILGALGAWYVQTGTLSWIPVIWSIPMSTLVIAILHANNWRDIESDSEGKIITIAALLGDKRSLRYYGFLIYGPFLMVLGLILIPHFLVPDFPALPYTFFITMLALPMAIGLWRKALNRKKPMKPIDFIALDGATAKLNLTFGMLSTLALVLELIIHIS
ncbi:MAG: 1,4-dihydroxy-2-naphthoate octaprenyltransferase [Bacteroidales bacterium]